MTAISFLTSNYSCLGPNKALDRVEASVKRHGIRIGRVYSTSNNFNLISPRLSSNQHLQTIIPLLATKNLLKYRLAVSSCTESEVSDHVVALDGNDLLLKVKQGVSLIGEKIKEALGELTVPHETNFWGALQVHDHSTRNSCLNVHTTSAWRGVVGFSFVWVLHRLKTNVKIHALTCEGLNRETFLLIESIVSLVLFIVGGMALAVACGFSMSTVLTVGGIAGAVIAAVCRNFLQDILSASWFKLSQRISTGDTISFPSQDGSSEIEGQVACMGPWSTAVLSAKPSLIMISYSLLSQITVTKPATGFRDFVSKISIPIPVDEFEKILEITREIKNMMADHSNVISPYCYVSRVERTVSELSLECNIKESKDELFSVYQDVLQQQVEIIKKHVEKCKKLVIRGNYKQILQI